MSEGMSEGTPYGGYPAMPGEPAGPPAAAGPAPSTVLTAVKLMFARAAVSLLGLFSVLASRDTLEEQIRASQPTASGATLESAVNVALTVGLVFGVVFLVLYVLLALQVRKGRSWARIVTFVLAGLAIASALGSLLQPANSLSRVVALITLLLDVAIIYLLAQKRSGAYFASRS